MKVLLRENISGLGLRGDIVEVKDGYARNSLIPTGKALQATPKIALQAEAMVRSRVLKDAKNKSDALLIAQRLEGQVVSIPARAGKNGKLYGSITTADISGALLDQLGVEVDRRKIHEIEAIRSVGDHAVTLKLHSEVEVALAIKVEELSQS